MQQATVRILPIILLLLVLFSASFVNAAESVTDDITAYFRVMWGLLIVLAIMLALFAIFKKRFSIMNPRSGKSIRVLEIQPLMPRKSLCLVEVKGKEYLLGVGNETITLLAALDPGEKTSFKEALDESQTRRQS